jgi:hypothetical protein
MTMGLQLGSVGMVTSGRVSSNFITGEEAQGTFSEGVIIGDTKVEIDGGGRGGGQGEYLARGGEGRIIPRQCSCPPLHPSSPIPFPHQVR